MSCRGSICFLWAKRFRRSRRISPCPNKVSGRSNAKNKRMKLMDGAGLWRVVELLNYLDNPRVQRNVLLGLVLNLRGVTF